MCAALFGLIAVCSTMALPPAAPRAGAAERQPLAQERRSVEKEVQIAVGCRGDTCRTPSSVPKSPAISCGDRPRRLAQPARQFEGHRRAEVAEVAVGRVLEGDGWLRRGVEGIERASAAARGAREGGRERAGSSVSGSGEL